MEFTFAISPAGVEVEFNFAIYGRIFTDRILHRDLQKSVIGVKISHPIIGCLLILLYER